MLKMFNNGWGNHCSPHNSCFWDVSSTTDKSNLPLNLSSIQELVYICWESNDQNKYYFDILRCFNIYLILFVILNLVLSVFYSNTLDVILMNDLVIIWKFLASIQSCACVFNRCDDCAVFCSRIFLFHHHFSETILMFFYLH